LILHITVDVKLLEFILALVARTDDGCEDKEISALTAEKDWQRYRNFRVGEFSDRYDRALHGFSLSAGSIVLPADI